MRRLLLAMLVFASASIFLPATGIVIGALLYDAGLFGYYWSSVPCSGNGYAWNPYFNSGGLDVRSYYSRDYGLSVRAVQGFTE